VTNCAFQVHGRRAHTESACKFSNAERLLHRLYETFDEGSDFYIVTELVEGGELFDRIVSKAHYTEKEARDLIKSLLETLNYMHTTGVVHRDLKPENLLLCSGALTLRHLTVSWLYVVSG
jgi:serine/threonine protein kinase